MSTFSNWGMLCATVLVGFLLTPYIIRSVGKDGYGIWGVIVSFIGYFGLLRFGVGSAIIRYVPLYDGHGEQRKVCGTVSTALSIYTGVGIVVLAASFLGAGDIARFFGEGADFMLLVRLIGLATAIECPAIILDATIRAREEYVGANILALLTLLFRTIGTIVVLWLGHGLVGLGWVTVASAALGLLFNIIGLVLLCPDIKVSINNIKTNYARELFSFGLLVTLDSLGLLLAFQSDKVIVAKYIDMETVGIYSVIALMVFYYREINGALVRTLVPRFGYLDGLQNHQQKTALFLKSTNAVTNMASGVGLVMLLAGSSFVTLWVGTGFESAYQPLLVLGVAHILQQSQTPSISFLAGSGKQGAVAVFAIIEGISVVILSILLVRQYGLTGVAVAIAIPRVIISTIARPLYVCRSFNIRISEYYLKCTLKPWALLALFAVTGLLLRTEMFLSTWPALVAFSIIIGFMYALAAYHFTLISEVKIIAPKWINHIFLNKDASVKS